MKKEELASILSNDGMVPNLGEIEDHLAVIARDISLPRFEIGMCTARIEEAGPPLRALLAKAAQGEELSEDEKTLFFRGLHILGGARDTESFPLLMRLLRRPSEEIDDLLGDAVTQNLAQIATGMFDGDGDTLFGLIADPSIDEYIRGAIFGTATFLTWEGRIDRERMHGFLERFHDERLAGEDDDGAWQGWWEAIALLGFSDLKPLYERACEAGYIDWAFADFDEDLARAQEAPADIGRFKDAGLGYIEDVVVSLEWTDFVDEDLDDEDFVGEELDEEEEPPRRSASFNTPETNPFRHVGRNDPCPCGSGKKAKKCCLAT